MSARATRIRDWSGAWLAACALAAVGCGGSGAPPARATTPEGHDGPSTTKQEGDDSAEADPPKAAPCADGTCFECGAGLCPKGFYCDEKAPSGAACAWLPECAEAPSCDCITRGLGAGCSCEQRSGGAYAKCE